MVDRRSVLKAGAASVAGALVGMPTVLSAAPADSPRPLHAAVFVRRFRQGAAFAEEMQRRNVAIFSAGNDIAQLWYSDLAGGLNPHNAPIAGLTDRVTLFCLEELARSAGMRVLYRVDHFVNEHGNVEHNAVGPASVVEATGKLTSTSAFGREMAVLACRFEYRELRDTSALKHTGPFCPGNKVVLVSWMIA